MNPTVSILTVTQWSRRDFMQLLVSQILSQDYSNIMEWNIVEGTGGNPSISQEQKQEYIRQNKHFICNTIAQKLKDSNSNIKLNYIDYSGDKFSEMMNVGNNACTGNIIVIMEDDDYYPTTRVSHAVERLEKNPDKRIAGCSNIFIYYMQDDSLYQFKTFHENHSCNHALAYKQCYLDNHSFIHNDDRPYSIESSFLNNYNEPMIQLDAIQTVVKVNHCENTMNLVMNPVEARNMWLKYNYMKPIDMENHPTFLMHIRTSASKHPNMR